jgi:dienelactone hydrolase
MMALTLRWRARAVSRQLVVVVLLTLLVATVLLGALSDGHLDALKAAGAFHGTPIGGVENFVEKLKGSVVWLGATAMSLVIAVVGIMFMAGHSRAHDVAIKTIAGLAILASVSGIVA